MLNQWKSTKPGKPERVLYNGIRPGMSPAPGGSGGEKMENAHRLRTGVFRQNDKILGPGQILRLPLLTGELVGVNMRC